MDLRFLLRQKKLNLSIDNHSQDCNKQKTESCLLLLQQSPALCIILLAKILIKLYIILLHVNYYIRNLRVGQAFVNMENYLQQISRRSFKLLLVGQSLYYVEWHLQDETSCFWNAKPGRHCWGTTHDDNIKYSINKREQFTTLAIHEIKIHIRNSYNASNSRFNDQCSLNKVQPAIEN